MPGICDTTATRDPTPRSEADTRQPPLPPPAESRGSSSGPPAHCGSGPRLQALGGVARAPALALACARGEGCRPGSGWPLGPEETEQRGGRLGTDSAPLLSLTLDRSSPGPSWACCTSRPSCRGVSDRQRPLPFTDAGSSPGPSRACLWSSWDRALRGPAGPKTQAVDLRVSSICLSVRPLTSSDFLDGTELSRGRRYGSYYHPRMVLLDAGLIVK